MKTEDFTNADEPTDDSKDFTGLIMGTVLSFVFLLFTFVIVDYYSFSGGLSINLFLKPDCNYVMPDKFSILTDGKYYIVKYEDGIYKDKYLSGDIFDIRDWYKDIKPPVKLWSECKAKAYIKRFVKEQNPVIGFKPIVK